MRMLGPHDVWIVGVLTVLPPHGRHPHRHALAMHWNGSTWTSTDTSSARLGTSLNSVDGVDTAHLWAVGDRVPPTRAADDPVILRWRRGAWRSVRAPFGNAQDTPLSGVSALSGHDAWLSGSIYYDTTDGGSSGLAAHWDGQAWTPTPGANEHDPAYEYDTNYLLAIDAVSSHEVYAVGQHGAYTFGEGRAPDRALVLRWDGSAWNVDASIEVAGRRAGLTGVDALGSGAAWAVGASYGSPSEIDERNLILRRC